MMVARITANLAVALYNGTYAVHLYWWNETHADWQHVKYLQEEINITLTCYRYVQAYNRSRVGRRIQSSCCVCDDIRNLHSHERRLKPLTAINFPFFYNPAGVFLAVMLLYPAAVLVICIVWAEQLWRKKPVLRFSTQTTCVWSNRGRQKRSYFVVPNIQSGKLSDAGDIRIYSISLHHHTICFS